MSRIERALEQAVKSREQKKETGQADPGLPKAGLPEMPRIEPSFGEFSPYLITLADPESPISEEYRKLKSMVVRISKAGTFQNALMVTSATTQEGKTITALNLAITLAQEYDNTVLLVDADLRRPSVHEYLGIKPKLGLTDCLAGGANISEALIKTGIGKLAILPSGGKVSNPAEMIGSGRMKELARELKSRYGDRYLIFDAPPVLSFADARTIGPLIDGVLFVVREGHASLDSVKDALGILKNIKIFGVVYNKASISRFDYAYDHYYRGYPRGRTAKK